MDERALGQAGPQLSTVGSVHVFGYKHNTTQHHANVCAPSSITTMSGHSASSATSFVEYWYNPSLNSAYRFLTQYHVLCPAASAMARVSSREWIGGSSDETSSPPCPLLPAPCPLPPAPCSLLPSSTLLFSATHDLLEILVSATLPLCHSRQTRTIRNTVSQKLQAHSGASHVPRRASISPTDKQRNTVAVQ